MQTDNVVLVTPLSNHSTLKKRVLTACILIPLVLFIIFYFPLLWFALVCVGVFLMADWEWTALAGFQTILGRVFCFFAIPCVALIFLILIKVFTEQRFLMYQLGPASFGLEDSLFRSMAILRLFQFLIIGGWVLAALAVYFYPRGKSFYASRGMGVLIGTWVLVPTFAALVALFTLKPSLVLYPMVLVWVADSAAYFVGKRFGRHPLAPNVSAGKTWEGVLGAVLGSIVVAVFGYFIFQINISFIVWTLFNIIVVLFSIVGDLFESIFKRLRNLKDSGKILPGHGGLLDRIDSLTAALPIFAVLLMSL